MSNGQLSSVASATRELTRLEGIRDNLSGLIVELKSTEHSSADTWIRIYNERLNDNVMPQIKEVREYLIQQSMMVR